MSQLLCLLLLGKKKKKAKGIFGQDTPCWLCCMGFSQLLGAIKS
jgi:hypothetical protein